MTSTSANNIKLGFFVLGGLAFLILLLYMIGRNSNFFQQTYTLKTRFRNIQGLVAGNNVRYAGIESGTVRKVTIINDTVVEVTMAIDKKLKNVIRNNAVASIGTDGLVGNRVLNIVSSPSPAPHANENDVLASKESIDTDAMLRTLSVTNDDVAALAAELRKTVERLNNSEAIWQLMNDKSAAASISKSIYHIRDASAKAENIAAGLDEIVVGIAAGKGSLGVLLTDTQLVADANKAIRNVSAAGAQADSLGNEIRMLVSAIDNDMKHSSGAVNALLKDSLLVQKLHVTLDNLQAGTDGFNENMEALKHNFLFRRYFRKQEKDKKRNMRAASGASH